jgi:hypothetical protein
MDGAVKASSPFGLGLLVDSRPRVSLTDARMAAMTIPSAYLSKSRFTTGLQCHRQLWWRVHQPDAPELVPDEALAAIFEQGIRIGETARRYVPGGVLVDLPYRELDQRVAFTRQLLDAGVPAIYEATFFKDGVRVDVDILERHEQGVGIVEVKSSSRVKEPYLADAAIQAHVVIGSGVPVDRVEIMVLNRACRHPDLSNLFVRHDVTSQVAARLDAMPVEAGRQLQMLVGPLPQVTIGDHCRSPFECPFMDRCWPPMPAHHVSTLFQIGKFAHELVARGVSTITELPPEILFEGATDRQRRAVQAGRVVVEDGLAEALEVFQSPLAFLDFETLVPPIPAWPGCRPFDPVPVQFSCHVERSGGWDHYEWLATGRHDPRPSLVRRIAEACRNARTIVAYYADYERRCLELAAESFPELRDECESLIERIRDPLPIVRDYVYHPDFGGSFGLKSVLPALVPELSYEDLEVAEGLTASVRLGRLLLDPEPMDPEMIDRWRDELLRYCERDTWGMVKLLDKLREFAG